MTCYFRHLQLIFEKAGIAVTNENKKELDEIIHHMVKVKYKNCSATWKEVKNLITEDEDAFVSRLKAAWDKH